MKQPPIPPQWTDVKRNNRKERAATGIVATGYDVKGRKQTLYTLEWQRTQSDCKFKRVRELIAEHQKVGDHIEQDAIDGYEAGKVAWLIFTTGMRPGGNGDTKADVQAYGATTLLCKHIKILASGNIRLKFVGKKGVGLNIPVTDPILVEDLRRRKLEGKPNSTVFKCSASTLRNYLQSFCPYNAKDFRTAKGIMLAEALLAKKRRIPKAKTKRKRIINAILDQVAKVLGNTRAVARKSYVDPVVWEGWLDDE